MKTTLHKIKEKQPCSEGWEKLLKHLNKTKADNEELDLMVILESNGIKDAIWALRCFDYKDYCLFLADVAESVLHIYEKKYDNPAPRNAIQAIRDYKVNGITKERLHDAADAADAAFAAYTAADADAAYAAYAAYTAAAADAADAAAAYAARKKKWEEIEQLFIEHFNNG